MGAEYPSHRRADGIRSQDSPQVPAETGWNAELRAAAARVLIRGLRERGFDGGYTILTDWLRPQLGLPEHFGMGREDADNVARTRHTSKTSHKPRTVECETPSFQVHTATSRDGGHVRLWIAEKTTITPIPRCSSGQLKPPTFS